MSAAAVRGVVRRLGPTADPPTDADLVGAFAARRDHAAFAELVRRHGPTVLGVCRRVLADAHDAEDAFQAVFLVLAKKAATVRPAGAVGGWLYGVAVRTANKAKVAAARRRRREMIAAVASQHEANPDREGGGGLASAELRSVLDAELANLPAAMRAAVVLCDLHGKTRSEAAAELRCPEGTVAARLHRGRKKLGEALARRGLALPAAGLVAVLAPVPVSAALSQSAFALASGTASVAVRALAHEVIRSMTTITNTLAIGFLTLLTGGLLAAGTLLSGEPASGQKGPPVTDPPVALAPAPKPPASAWREMKVLEQAGWLAGSVVYSPDGATLYVGGTGEHVGAYTTDTWKRRWGRFDGPGTLPPPGSHFGALAVAPDDKTLAVTTKDGVVFIDTHGRATGAVLEEKGSAPLAVALFPEVKVEGADPLTSRKVIFGDARGYFVKSWIEKTWLERSKVSTITTSTVAADKKPADEYAVPLAVSPDGKRAVATGPIDPGTGKNVLWAWSAGSGEGNKLLEGHKAMVTAAAWSKDGKLIVTGDADGVVISWDAATFKEKSRQTLGGRVAAVAISAGGDRAADGDAGEPLGKLVRRRDGVIEINLGSDAGVRPGDAFTVLPFDFPEKGRKSRIRTVRTPDGTGEFKQVERFVEKAVIEVTEVLGPNLSRCKITREFDPIRDGAGAGDLIYKPAGQGTAQHVAAAVVSPMPKPNGRGDYSEVVFVWEAANPPERLKWISSHDAGGPFTGVASLAFAPDGRTLASAFCNFDHLSKLGELTGKVRVFALEVEKLKPKPKPEPKPEAEPAVGQKWTDAAILTDHGTLVNGVAVAPDGKTFAAATNGNVTCWDSATRKVLWKTKPGDAPFHALAYSGDSKTLFAADKTEVVRLDVATGEKAKLFGNATGVAVENATREIKDIRTRVLAVSPDGKRLAGSDGYATWMIEPDTRDLSGALIFAGSAPKDAQPGPAGVSWSADGKSLAVITPKQAKRTVPSGVAADTHWPVQLWTGGGKGFFVGLFGHDKPVTAVAWSKDGKLVASGGEDGLVILWDAETGKELWRKELKGRTTTGRVNALAISPADNTVAVAASMGSGKGPERVVLLDPKEGRDVGFLQAASIPVSSVAWSPDGKFLLTGCGAAGRAIAQNEPAVGEVVVWERAPDAVKQLREQLKTGTPREKSAALNTIRELKPLALIPDVIEAIEDPTSLPREGDTGWGFVGHQAASVLGEMARTLDNIEVGMGPEKRAYQMYSFHNDQGEGGQKLKESGRLAEVRKNWAKWWDDHRNK